MTGLGYPEASTGMPGRSSTSGASSAAADPPFPGYGNMNQSINLLMSAAGGLLVLVGFVAFGIWLCGRCSSSRSGRGRSVGSSEAAVVKPGLSKEAIARIPVVVDPEPGKGSDCCAICLGEFSSSSGSSEDCRARILPECRHRFHIECIDMWLFSHKTCPTCRSDLSRLEQREPDAELELKILVVPESTSTPVPSPPAAPAAA